LNAGVEGLGPFLENTNQEIETNVNVNALHVIYFAKVMANQLVKRYD
jgi:short-subunit dehydrogenase